MSDFLLELYSEEIPHGLQINTRKSLEASFLKSLEDENIKCKQDHFVINLVNKCQRKKKKKK